MEEKNNLPKQYFGGGSQKKFYASDLLVRKIAFEIDTATIAEGLKDCQVAEKLGISRQTYSRMKNQKSINMGNVEAIAHALGYEVEVRLVKKENSNGEK